ncbi:hypothetical protein SEVIR_3G260450v4 [Setaria viridis]|uniref:Uncharacterized protein n=1 Tax=Setaria viridis TaxID=4556 RepID=A0A4U6VS30_SETVI|nr:hypothetical protein SEVIR_3G260450v2 [Setaria viridis]
MEYLKRCSKNLLFRSPHGVGIIYPPLPLVTQFTSSVLIFLSPPTSSFPLPWGAGRRGRPAGGASSAAARPGRRPAGGELPRGGGAAGAQAGRANRSSSVGGAPPTGLLDSAAGGVSRRRRLGGRPRRGGRRLLLPARAPLLRLLLGAAVGGFLRGAGRSWWPAHGGRPSSASSAAAVRATGPPALVPTSQPMDAGVEAEPCRECECQDRSSVSAKRWLRSSSFELSLHPIICITQQPSTT